MRTLAVHPGSKMVTGTPPQAAREKHMATRWSSYLRWQREPGGGAARMSDKPGAQIIGGHGSTRCLAWETESEESEGPTKCRERGKGRGGGRVRFYLYVGLGAFAGLQV